MSGKSNGKVLILGFDGADPTLLSQWMAAGHLPTISKVIAEGAYGPLQSVPNMGSPAAWTTFATGKNAGKHAIFSFTERDFNSYRYTFVNGGYRKARTYWEILCPVDGDRTGCIINVPMTFPAQQLNGSMISGFDAPGTDSQGICYPDDLLKRMEEANGPYRIIRDVGNLLRKGDEWGKAGQDLLDYMEMRHKHASWLMDNTDWDLFTVVFGETDHAQHFYWKFLDPSHPDYKQEEADLYGDTILRIYQKMDDLVGRFIEQADGATVLIMSDHGGGLNSRGGHIVPDWLEGMGLLVRESTDWRNPKQLIGGLGNAVISKAYNIANRTLSTEMKFKLIKLFPMVREKVEFARRLGDVDWSRTRAYSDGIQDDIWINLKGRDPMGIVPTEEYDDLCDRICSELRGAVDPVTGEPIVEYVFRRNEAYSGKYVDSAPDISFRWMQKSVVSGIKTESYTPPTSKKWDWSSDIFNGGHSKDGIVIAHGPGITAGNRLTGAGIQDIAPTIFYLFDEEIPADMDGKVLESLFDREKFSARPPRFGGDAGEVDFERDDLYSEEDSEVIEQRLRGLGYI